MAHDRSRQRRPPRRPHRPVRGDTPPPRTGRGARPRKPPIPGERPRLARDVYRDLRAASPPKDADDVLRAFGGAGEALEQGDTARAIELLTWAKSAASRSGAVREALGVALYLAGDYLEAHRELLAYRRMTGRHDQDHLLADCARALGRPEKVAEYVADLQTHRVAPDRVAEGLIVLAADRADRGDLEGAFAVLRQADLHPRQIQAWHPRLWFVAADLAERMGDATLAREYREAIASVDPTFLDVDRLASREPEAEA